MIIGTQYYRAPFPEERYWEEDLAAMKSAGLNALQLWVVWGWVEPSPGKFQFDDYDKLIELAGKNKLQVVLSTIGAIHPYWIHDEVPGSEMITNMGHKVISSNRGECHFGLTPGGCLDHPCIWDRMAAFLETTAKRYKDVPHLAGWDVWNELRWNVQADGFVCYCPHTLERFRRWLQDTYGDLEQLNTQWKRRYRRWEDVFPGKMPGRPYTEMMAFERFLTWRSNDLARKRYDIVKTINPDRIVTMHGGAPSIIHGTDSYKSHTTVLHRGNDWNMAEIVDEMGCSSFPAWMQVKDDSDLLIRYECLRSAAGNKPIWLSELQGGRAATGLAMHRPVLAADQQRWIWAGIGSNAKTILFWCWRDEVFGRESSGFGFSGADGHAKERIAAMKRTRSIIDKNKQLIESYRKNPGRVGVWFSPESYYLDWAVCGNAKGAMNAILGYARALLHQDIPFRFIEEQHLDESSEIAILFMPKISVVPEQAELKIQKFVEAGGVLVVESEFGAFGTNGVYSYPSDRFLTRLAGIQEVGRRDIKDNRISGSLYGNQFTLGAMQWTTPFIGDEKEELIVQRQVGKGTVVGISTYSGQAYFEGSNDGVPEYAASASNFERFIGLLCSHNNVHPPVTIEYKDAKKKAVPFIISGESSGIPMLFVSTNNLGQPIKLVLNESGFIGRYTDIISNKVYETIDEGEKNVVYLTQSEWGVYVLVHD